MRLLLHKSLLTSILLLLTTSLNAQGTLRGTVTDSLTQKPLISASVFLSGTAMGAATDIEASASLMVIYSFAKGFNKGYLPKEFFNTAQESYSSVFENLVTTDSNGMIYLNNVCSVAGLGGNPYRDGSFEYYISEPKRVNDFKGYGPLILASIEIEKGH